jgi:hypothetical protein
MKYGRKDRKRKYPLDSARDQPSPPDISESEVIGADGPDEELSEDSTSRGSKEGNILEEFASTLEVGTGHMASSPGSLLPHYQWPYSQDRDMIHRQ